MAYIKLADGSTFQGLDEDVAKAVAAYASTKSSGNDFNINDLGKIRISPEVTKIVEKVPVEVEKIVEKMVAVPVLPERPLTKDEMEFITNLTKQASKQKTKEMLFSGLGIAAFAGVIFGLCYFAAKNDK